MTFAEVIRAAIPGATEDVIDHVLWGRTPFPCGRVSARDLYGAARTFGRASAKGLILCEQCDRAVPSGIWVCERCDAMLRPHPRA